MTATAPAIDLSTPKSYAVNFGPSIAAKGKYASVRYNHKPTGTATACKITGSDESVKLSLQTDDGAKEWQYAGRTREERETYVLVFEQGGVTLEKLERSYAVNLTNAPEGEGSGFEQLPDEDAWDGEADSEPDVANPFDWRHFLRAAEDKARKTQSTVVDTPSIPAAVGKATSRAAPAPTAAGKKRKTPASTTKANPKRVKAGLSPPSKAVEAKQQKRDIPEVRLDRKASTVASQQLELVHNDDDDDDGELILENDSPKRSKHLAAGGSMGLALQGAFAGPRSLRSAASTSPGVQSPVVEAEKRSYEFEFGEEEDEEGDGDADADADADVEDLALGSPAREVGGVEEEDDMEAQLALAMAQPEEEEEEVAAPESEEDVSEEE